MNINKKKVLSDSIFLSIGQLLVRLKGLIFIPFVVNTVGMAAYGAFIQIIVNKQIFVPFTTLAMEMGFLRYTSKIDDDDIKGLSRDYWSVILISFVLSLLGAGVHYMLAPMISRYILAGTSLEALRLSSLFIITGCLSVQNTKFILSRKHFKLFSIYKILYGIVPAIGFIYGILTKASLYYGILYYIVIEGLIVLALMSWVIRSLTFVWPNIKRLIKFIKYSWALVLSSITGGFLSKVDRYFIGFFLGPAAIGIYNIIYSACALLDAISMPFLKYFGTYLPKYWDEGKKRQVIGQLKEGLIYYLVLAFGALICLIFMLEPVVRLFLNRDITYITNFQSLICIIGFGMIALGVTRFFTQLIKYREQNYLQLIFQCIGVALNIVLNIILIKTYGLLGAGIATFISYSSTLLLYNYFLDIHIDSEFTKRMFRIGMAGCIIVFWFIQSHVNNFYDLAQQIGIGLTLYVAMIFLFRAVCLKDLKRNIT